MYGDVRECPTELPSVGDDHCVAYGYAEEHHPAEIWLRMALTHWRDIEENSTPETCHRSIDLSTSFGIRAWVIWTQYVELSRRRMQMRYRQCAWISFLVWLTCYYFISSITIVSAWSNRAQTWFVQNIQAVTRCKEQSIFLKYVLVLAGWPGKHFMRLLCRTSSLEYVNQSTMGCKQMLQLEVELLLN